MNEENKRSLRIIVNGKSGVDPQLRPAVAELRQHGHDVGVRVTWEAGDACRFAKEAMNDAADVIVAAGGDGTIHEIANGMFDFDPEPKPALAVIPYGTANDFATSMGIDKGNPKKALQLAAHGVATAIDVGRVNERIFVNVTSGGFGAEASANTPAQIKRAFGGAAYSLMGIVAASKLNPQHCRFTTPDGTLQDGNLLILAVGNGRQCGGGYQVTPKAYLNDGLLDLFIVHDADLTQFGAVLSELLDPTDEHNQFVTYKKLCRFTLESDRPLPLSLDGEPYTESRFEFELLPKRLRFILGPDAPLA